MAAQGLSAGLSGGRARGHAAPEGAAGVDVGARTNVAGAQAAVEARASDLSKSFANTRFTYVRRRLNPYYFALLGAAKQIGELTKGKDDEARTIARPVIDGVRAAVAASGEQIGRSRERWRAETPRDGSPPERWEAFLIKFQVLADPGA